MQIHNYNSKQHLRAMLTSIVPFRNNNLYLLTCVVYIRTVRLFVICITYGILACTAITTLEIGIETSNPNAL